MRRHAGLPCLYAPFIPLRHNPQLTYFAGCGRQDEDVATSWYYSFLLSVMEGGKASSKEHNVLPVEEEEDVLDISRANPLSLIKKAVDMSLSLNLDKEKENLDE
ncbi:hypothetical protein NDU88_004728 [Pleurodeles waltl]|uniref:Uncharacterized protein n=1 Tax=Pleurodeles waltl TaxID=8319 RepID=A0AAV7T9Y9_PLEWA|nr:hypothetical protein NDU88_004728 [Pleurodeles waltl]